MSGFSALSFSELCNCLLDLNQPLGKRTHAAFYLRTIGNLESAHAIAAALKCKDDCSLMRHELAYILGQMRLPISCSTLESILQDECDEVVVRHEAAEALGAIGQESSIVVLQKYINDPHPEISETCKIALDLIAWKLRNIENIDKRCPFLSIDPAPPTDEKKTVDELKFDLNNESMSLFSRYRAMFALRNLNSDKAALALVSGFADSSSALFRHEVAYVLGQMDRSVAIPGLIGVLVNPKEHSMVRHEAAEALGAIGGAEAVEALRLYSRDSDQIVRDSCHVALDTLDYWAEFSSTSQSAPEDNAAL